MTTNYFKVSFKQVIDTYIVSEDVFFPFDGSDIASVGTAFAQAEARKLAASRMSRAILSMWKPCPWVNGVPTISDGSFA